MKTTRIFTYCLFSFLLFCFCACESPVQSVIGEYSFKVSGQVTKDGSDLLALPDEMGTMDIIHLNDSNFLLTFNTLNGSAYTTEAVLSNKQLNLHPFSRTITLTHKSQSSDILGGIIELTETEHYSTDVYGYGTIYGETIKFTLQYSGEELTNGKKIKGSNILMLAKKN